MKMILLVILLLCCFVYIVDQNSEVEPDEFWDLLKAHPELQQFRWDMTEDQRITRKEMRFLYNYLDKE
jgi:hypothetical protein